MVSEGGIPLPPSGRGEGHNVAGGACGSKVDEEATPKRFSHTPAPTTAKAVPLPLGVRLRLGRDDGEENAYSPRSSVYKMDTATLLTRVRARDIMKI